MKREWSNPELENLELQATCEEELCYCEQGEAAAAAEVAATENVSTYKGHGNGHHHGRPGCIHPPKAS